ncbi:MAG: DEAD/DEAH box helicase [Bacteroidota bacterium]|nr:DEAD/DEAH box helicase [Bacteroidota bacterium]
MFRKFVTKLKSFFGTKPKVVPTPPTSPIKESKPHPHQHKKYPYEKAGGVHHPRDIRRPKQHELPSRNKQIIKVAREEPKVSAPIAPWDGSVFKVPVIDGKTRFHDLNLPAEIMHAIFDSGFQYTTQVQAEVFPKSLAGDDVSAQAQTGTGKTAAFLITIFAHILRNPITEKRKHGTPRALILAPTRELVMQIEKDAHTLAKYTQIAILSLVGGIDYNKQMQNLKHEPVDIVVATPGRLIDFKKQKLLDLGRVEILIIDEADRMLDMGFIPAVRSIVLSTPQKSHRQTMFFTATMNSEVKRLAESWTRQAIEVTILPDEIAVSSVEQITYITTKDDKFTLFYNVMMQKHLERVLVFVNRKDVARDLKERMETYGITCTLLSGDVDQRQRIKRLENFREGKVRVLVATDVASRGIHVEAISHVVNYNLPQDPEEFVHRIGRTGRAGAKGIAISFADEEDSYEIPRLEEYMKKKMECIYPDETLLTPAPEVFQRTEMRREKTERRNFPRRRNFKRPPRKIS